MFFTDPPHSRNRERHSVGFPGPQWPQHIPHPSHFPSMQNPPRYYPHHTPQPQPQNMVYLPHFQQPILPYVVHQPQQPPPQPLPPPVLEPPEVKDWFQKNQQFQKTMAAIEMQNFCDFSQVRQFYATLNDEAVKEADLPDTLDLTLNMYGNEFRHLIVQLPTFGNPIVQEIPLLYAKTGCQIVLTDRVTGPRSETNKVKFSGTIRSAENAMKDFLGLLPQHFGLHMENLKDDFKAMDLRNRLHEWVSKDKRQYDDISFHFVVGSDHADKEAFQYVVLRHVNSDVDALIAAANSFNKWVMKPSKCDEFATGYRLSNNDRVWFVGSDGGRLASAICKMSDTTMKYSNSCPQAPTMNLSVYGKPEKLIRADLLLRKVAPMTLEFDVDDDSLEKPYGTNPTIVENLIEEELVLISFAKSKYQIALPNQKLRIRHRITLKTSYENRAAMYRIRRRLIKDLPPENAEIEAEENLMFTEHLRTILKTVADKNLDLHD